MYAVKGILFTSNQSVLWGSTHSPKCGMILTVTVDIKWIFMDVISIIVSVAQQTENVCIMHMCTKPLYRGGFSNNEGA